MNTYVASQKREDPIINTTKTFDSTINRLTGQPVIVKKKGRLLYIVSTISNPFTLTHVSISTHILDEVLYEGYLVSIDITKLVLRINNQNGGSRLETIALLKENEDPYEIIIRDTNPNSNCEDDNEKNYEVCFF